MILNYEELLHNADTRELVTSCIQDRDNVLRQLIKEGLEKNEIKNITILNFRTSYILIQLYLYKISIKL